MTVRFSNDAKTTLTTGINATATSLSVASAATFPSLSGAEYTYITLSNVLDTQKEIVKCTAINGSTFTVTRGAESTTAQSFNAGDHVQIRITAGLFSDVLDEKVDDGQVLTNVPAGAVFTDTVYSHPAGDGNQHVPATSTTNEGKLLTAGSTAGSASWQPAPVSLPAQAGNAGSRLTTDGTVASWVATVGGTTQSVTATANQTTFSAAYSVGYVAVYLNGILLDATDYTASNGTSIVLGSGATVGDTVFIQSFGTFELADHYNKADADARYVQADGSNLTGGNSVVVGTTLPSPASTVGSLFYTSGDDRFYISDGTAWSLVGNQGPEVTGGTVVIPSVVELSGYYSYDLGIDFTDDVNPDSNLTYTLQSGTLPTGCVIVSGTTQHLGGTIPAVSSNILFSFQIKATDRSGAYSTQNYQQLVTNEVPITTGGSYQISNIQLGQFGSYNVNSNFTYSAGSIFSAYSLSTGALPTGTSLNTATGVISGTVSQEGTYIFNIMATAVDGGTSEQTYNWDVLNADDFGDNQPAWLPRKGDATVVPYSIPGNGIGTASYNDAIAVEAGEDPYAGTFTWNGFTVNAYGSGRLSAYHSTGFHRDMTFNNIDNFNSNKNQASLWRALKLIAPAGNKRIYIEMHHWPNDVAGGSQGLGELFYNTKFGDGQWSDNLFQYFSADVQIPMIQKGSSIYDFHSSTHGFETVVSVTAPDAWVAVGDGAQTYRWNRFYFGASGSANTGQTSWGSPTPRAMLYPETSGNRDHYGTVERLRSPVLSFSEGEVVHIPFALNNGGCALLYAYIA